jgi:hypothetical protein
MEALQLAVGNIHHFWRQAGEQGDTEQGQDCQHGRFIQRVEHGFYRGLFRAGAGGVLYS